MFIHGAMILKEKGFLIWQALPSLHPLFAEELH
jgi:hypothetical protein